MVYLAPFESCGVLLKVEFSVLYVEPVICLIGTFCYTRLLMELLLHFSRRLSLSLSLSLFPTPPKAQNFHLHLRYFMLFFCLHPGLF